MYVSIHSTTVGSGSKGKKTWGFVSDLKDNAEVKRPHVSQSIGRHPWAITLRGASVHEYASGTRGGERIEVEAKVLVELTPRDVCDLVNLALSQGLLEIHSSLSKSEPSASAA